MARADQEVRDSTPAFIWNTTFGRSEWAAKKAAMVKERQEAINKLKAQLARDTKEINDACEKRVKDLEANYLNTARKSSIRH